MTESRAWERPDGTIVVRDGNDPVKLLAPNAEPPSDAVPLHPVPDVTDEDPRVQMLAEQLAIKPWSDTAPGWQDAYRQEACDLLARLDAAAPVARDRRFDDLYAQAEAWVNENVASRKTHPDSPTHSARRAALEEAANTVLNIVEGRLTGLAEHYARQAAPAQPAGCGKPGCTNLRSHRHEPINVRASVAPDTPDAVRQFREAIEHARWMPLVASHIQDRLDVVQAEVDRLRPKSVAPDTQSAAPTRDALVAAFKSKLVISGYDMENEALDWRAADEFDEAERMADVALGVLRGGGADGGGEDEEALRSLAVAVAASDEAPDMGLAWLTDYTHAETEGAWTAGTCVLGKCADRRYPDAVCEHGTDDHRREVVRLRRVVQRIGATNITHLSRQYRAICKRYGRASAEIARLRGENSRLRTEEREEVAKLRTKLTAARPHYGHIARLARAAGVSPDSEDVVGAIEAAIRAGREPDVASMLAELHGALGQCFGAADVSGNALRARLQREETEELCEALDANDPVGIAHELADVVIVAYGTAHTLGVPLDAVIAEVHRANMSKRGPDGTFPVRDDGKVLKGPQYRPPDVAAVLGIQAPAPAPAPLTVGDEVKTPEQLAALPEHAVLRDASFDVCERMHDRWKCFTGTDRIDLPARILDLPGGEKA